MTGKHINDSFSLSKRCTYSHVAISEYRKHYVSKTMEKEITYNPTPIDTSEVLLPEEMMALAERLAKNVHEVWALTRMEQGWTYGEQRDDQQKKHPCLIPYEDLPESEKEYDRLTAFETIKLVVKLGYKISK